MSQQRSVARGRAIEDLALLACHQRAPGFWSDDRRNEASLGVWNRFDFTVDQPRGSGVRADPEDALAIELEHTNPGGCRPISRELLNSTAIVLSQAAVSAEPHRAVRVLGDRVNVIRRKSVKKCDGAPLVETRG